MEPALPTKDEAARIGALQQYGILDTPAETPFDDLTLLASRLCDTPVALVSLVDTDRQWFKSRRGVISSETPRDVAFCAHAIHHPDDLFVVDDASLDQRFADNPLVTGGPKIRFYAGAPLVSLSGHAVGTLCVIDSKPRTLEPCQAEALRALARQAVGQLELRRRAAENNRLCGEAVSAACQAEHASLHDAVTGLPNRTLFARRVSACLDAARSDPSRRFAVMFIDLDRFKLVNDGLGHATGDRLLRAVGRRLRACFRGTRGRSGQRGSGKGLTTIARFGGDEFVILIDHAGSEADVRKTAERIIGLLARPVRNGAASLFPAASAGIVLGDNRTATVSDLLRDADAALYQAKAAGRGRYVLFDPAMHDRAVRSLRAEIGLRHALERDELLLHYQPVMSLRTGQVTGFEALLRWRRDGRLVSPGEFIPVAEETGLIVPIGAWVIREAVRQKMAWLEQHPTAAPVRMAVNVSRRQLREPGFVGLVADVLAEHAIAPDQLLLEITESVVMDDTSNARQTLAALRGLGVKLALDDFGSGYSSLSCLHAFPVDVLKVDQAFVANAADPREAAVLRAVIDLAHDLGTSVVAEGVETAAQRAFLTDNGCDFAQGYYLARPLPAQDAVKFLVLPEQTLAA